MHDHWLRHLTIVPGARMRAGEHKHPGARLLSHQPFNVIGIQRSVL